MLKSAPAGKGFTAAIAGPTAASAWLALVLAGWAGLIFGTSFLATAAKFLAPSLTIPVGLDVGRYTFRILSTAELIVAVFASVLCWRSHKTFWMVAGLANAWLVLLVDRFWLLPVLDARVSLYLAGSPAPPSYHHTLFAGLEVLKIAGLAVAAAASSWNLIARTGG
jgi:hypothetical protein